MSIFKFDYFLNTTLGTLVLLLVILQGVRSINLISGHKNELCLEECFLSLNLEKNSVKISHKLSPDLSLKSKEDILNLRRERVLDNNFLIHGAYQPNDRIYSKIASGLRWWGVDGYYQHLRSTDIAKQSITGRSLRGEEIYNPFFLITLKPLTYSVENAAFRWNLNSVPAISGSNCPYVPRKTAVLWKPAESKAEVVYFLNEFRKVLNDNNCLETVIKTDKISVGLDPVNAQDLGFNYLAFSTSSSKNIDYSKLKEDLIHLQFYYHRGTSCRIPEGCNNISPLVEDLFGRIKTTSLPARINAHLWKNKPESPSSEPDFRYIIHLR